jgi:hypothetical protein
MWTKPTFLTDLEFRTCYYVEPLRHADPGWDVYWASVIATDPMIQGCIKHADDDAYYSEPHTVTADFVLTIHPEDHRWEPPLFEITRFKKTDGPLTKAIRLSSDGALVSDGSACVMPRGTAWRTAYHSLEEFADGIAGLGSDEAIALGTLREDLPGEVGITVKAKLNGVAGFGAAVARTADHIVYRSGLPALALLDFDLKGMPAAVRSRLDAFDGAWAALARVVPELVQTARVVRASTSSNLSVNGKPLPGSDGQHIYLPVRDGGDAERFLGALHDRCWLHGFGWYVVGAAGQLLERSIIDRMVGRPERLVFEGAPVLDAPLVQAHRRATVSEGEVLDTLAACPPLTVLEKTRLRDLRAKEKHRLAADRAAAQKRFIAEQAARIVERTGCSADAARRTVEQQCEGVLLSDIALPFDAPELAGTTVGDVLRDPEKFVGETLADPLEGIAYGRCKAMIMRRADGEVWIYSFAHGRTDYELRHSAAAIEANLRDTANEDLIPTFVRLEDGLGATDRLRLRDVVSKRTGVGVRAVDQAVKEERARASSRRKAADAERRAAERTDPRPTLPVPAHNAEYGPVMELLNESLGADVGPLPPTRDIEGGMTKLKMRRIPKLHQFEIIVEDDEDPEQLGLARMTEYEVAELIERYLEFQEKGEAVRLPMSFVRDFMNRDDYRLPVASAISQLPIVLFDGHVLATEGLDRNRGIVFQIPKELVAILPKREDCTPKAVGEAQRRLCDEWLVDVNTSYEGKCVAIADALTCIERSLLRQRPIFFISAGLAEGGKTTLIHMLVMAVFGTKPIAAAWTDDVVERKKALFSYLLEAVPYLLWDNIPRGTTISCPHIEASCTSELYSDRRLGLSEVIATSCATVHNFTGNNITPRGDLASRALRIHIDVDRVDPANRPFAHNDIVGWTEAHRPELLADLYTILLGNPFLKTPLDTETATRFKDWQRVVGLAVEHAAAQHVQLGGSATCPPQEVNFNNLFRSPVDNDDETADLAEVLNGLATWSDGEDFQVQALTLLLSGGAGFTDDGDRNKNRVRDSEIAAGVRDYLKLSADHAITPAAVSLRLLRHADEPARYDDWTLILRSERDAHTKKRSFWVEIR